MSTNILSMIAVAKFFFFSPVLLDIFAFFQIFCSRLSVANNEIYRKRFCQPSRNVVEKKKWKKRAKLIANCYELTSKHNKTRLILIKLLTFSIVRIMYISIFLLAIVLQTYSPTECSNNPMCYFESPARLF